MTASQPRPRRDRRYCGAAKRRGDGTCTRPAGWGTDHPGYGQCKLHGGSMPNNRANALNQQASAELARLDLPPVEDPLSELARVCGQVLGWKDMLAGKVNALTSLRYENEAGGEQLRAEVALWERALDRCERFLTAMARLNIDERLARISEERAELIITVLTIALERAGIEGDLFDTVLTEFDTAFARQAGVTL